MCNNALIKEEEKVDDDDGGDENHKSLVRYASNIFQPCFHCCWVENDYQIH